MTTAIMRGSLFLLILSLLAGCSLLPVTPQPEPRDAELFAQGLDQYLTTSDLSTLKQLQQQNLHSDWQLRAEALVNKIEQQNQKQAQLRLLLQKKEQEISKLPDKNELALCQKQKDALVQDNLLLEKTLKRLKEVLIDTELQAK